VELALATREDIYAELLKRQEQGYRELHAFYTADEGRWVGTLNAFHLLRLAALCLEEAATDKYRKVFEPYERANLSEVMEEVGRLMEDNADRE
jgi:hypothetical protein